MGGWLGRARAYGDLFQIQEVLVRCNSIELVKGQVRSRLLLDRGEGLCFNPLSRACNEDFIPRTYPCPYVQQGYSLL